MKTCLLKLIGSFLLVVGLLVANFHNSYAAGAELFKAGGKSFKLENLSTADRQAIYDIEQEAFQKKLHLIKKLALDEHIKSVAKKKGKKVADIEKELLKTKEPSDADIKAYYEQIKHQIPPTYKYDQIKGELAKAMVQRTAHETRHKVIDKLMSEKKIAVNLKGPKAPVVKISTAGYPQKGNKKAKVTVVEFADYRCPHCKAAYEAVKELWPSLKKKVNFVFMDFPIKGPVSSLIAQGAYCAGKQGKFWEYHDAAFMKQSELAKDSPKKIASDLKLNSSKFDKCLEPILR